MSDSARALSRAPGAARRRFDAISFATGFDAMTGALPGIDIRGRNGVRLEDERVEHVNEGANISRKPRVFTPRVDSVGHCRRSCDEVAADGCRGFRLE